MKTESTWVKDHLHQFQAERTCPDCCGDRLRLVWQGGYTDSFGATCDPADPFFTPIGIDPPPAEDGGSAGMALPPNVICGAGVYLTTLDLGSALSPPTTSPVLRT